MLSSKRLVSAGRCLVRCRRRRWVVYSARAYFLLSGETLLAVADSIPAFVRTLVSVRSECSVSLAADYVIVFLRAVLTLRRNWESRILRIVPGPLLNLLLSAGHPPVTRLARERRERSSGSILLFCGTCISRSTA